MSVDRNQKRIKKIREHILKSGFPSEVEIGTVLRKDGWLVGNQWPYRDKTTGKIRPVDILAMKFGFPQSWLAISLLIECKKRFKGEWIFHTQEKEKEFLPLLGTLFDLLNKIKGTTFSQKITDLTPDDIMASMLSGLHLLDKTIRIGVFSITPKGKDEFHEAVMQIISALEGMKNSMKSFIIFPSIVFTGDMFEYYQENGETKIQPINHIQFITFIPESEGMYPCMIDVVRKSYFNDFLRMVNRDFYILSQLIRGKTIT
jgi:hypothetical protein